MQQDYPHLWIGTSNIVIPGNKNTFPAAFRTKSRLHYYGSLFNSVEINTSFYKTPLLKTYKRWSEEVPADFRFSVKLSNGVTHTKELKESIQPINVFIKAASGIGVKSGCILVQFPGKITLDYFNAVESIVREVANRNSCSRWKVAVEFRNPGWYIAETWEMLDEYKAAMVLHDIPKSKLMKPKGNANFVYVRFHGPKGDYRDSYTNHYLQDMADQMNIWMSTGKEVYAYFNNTIGNAFENALLLKSLLKW